jgi:CheY-like chemotaxis protein
LDARVAFVLSRDNLWSGKIAEGDRKMAVNIKDKLSMYSKTILLVDDVSLFTEMAKEFFRRDQVKLLTARSGPEAVAIIRATRPDIVFMDLFMPGGDGDVACQEIKSDNGLRSIPIVMLTSSSNPKDIERCQNAGCNGYIQKPLTRELVLETFKKYLKLPKWSGKRVKTNIQATFGVYSAKEFSGLVKDISIGGLYLETAQTLAANTAICLEFRLDNHQAPVVCKGRVAWLNTKNTRQNTAGSTGMGIEFTDIKTLDLLTIQSWLSKEEQTAP